MRHQQPILRAVRFPAVTENFLFFERVNISDERPFFLDVRSVLKKTKIRRHSTEIVSI